MVISEAPPVKSGIARVADELSRGLRGRGHTVDILSIHDIPRLEIGEVRLSSMILRLPQLRARIKEYDLVHLHGPVPTFSDVFLLSALRRRRHPPLIYTYHAPIDLRHLPFSLLTPVYNALQERLARLADHVVVTTPAYYERLGRFVPRAETVGRALGCKLRAFQRISKERRAVHSSVPGPDPSIQGTARVGKSICRPG